jgi:hypothetical protein
VAQSGPGASMQPQIPLSNTRFEAYYMDFDRRKEQTRKEQALNVQIRITRGDPYLHTEKHSIVKVHMQSIKIIFCSLLKVITRDLNGLENCHWRQIKALAI